MSDKLLYLRAEDIRALGITPAQARNALLRAFEHHHAGISQALEKGSLFVGPGHGFQTMVAADRCAGIASVKWVAMSPVEPGSGRTRINGLICVSDYVTGEPVAVMDGNEITLLRTAALSAMAAQLMVYGAPQSIGVIGCGRQAYAHVQAFRELFPSLRHVYAFSREGWQSEKLLEFARAGGLGGEACESYVPVLRNADIVITTVPGKPGLVPFLDANLLKSEVFVSAVDLGRSWIPDSFPAFQFLATDSLTQGAAPWDGANEEVKTARFDTDLTELAHRKPLPVAGRKLFCFKGYALADLALADLALRLARKQGGIGMELSR